MFIFLIISVSYIDNIKKQVSILFAILMFNTSMVYADCLEITDENLEFKEEDFGLTTAKWSARLNNQCNDPYDAMIDVLFHDEDEETVYTSMDVIVVQPNERTRAGRTVNIPSRIYEKIRDTKISIKERKRPM